MGGTRGDNPGLLMWTQRNHKCPHQTNAGGQSQGKRQLDNGGTG